MHNNNTQCFKGLRGCFSLFSKKYNARRVRFAYPLVATVRTFEVDAKPSPEEIPFEVDTKPNPEEIPLGLEDKPSVLCGILYCCSIDKSRGESALDL